jgi:hypothetical protein
MLELRSLGMYREQQYRSLNVEDKSQQTSVGRECCINLNQHKGAATGNKFTTMLVRRLGEQL